MKTVLIIALSFTLISCSDVTNTKSEMKKYSFDIQFEIDSQLSLLNADQLFCKQLISNSKTKESIDINFDEVKKTLTGLKEYDINKPALKNTYTTIISDTSIVFQSKEITYIKLVKIISNSHSKRILIELENNNNLFELNKRIDWKFNHSINIQSYKKVKGMEADEFNIYYDLRSNCDMAASIDSTGI